MKTSPSIRIVSESETMLLRTAWGWADDAPDWFREFRNIHPETLEMFLESAKADLLIGVFCPDIRALARFQLCSTGFYDIHLYVKRKTDPEVLFNACESIMLYLFDNGIKGLSGWIPRMHRSIVNLYKKLGFTYNGIRCFEGNIKRTVHGVTRPKVVEWYYFEKS